MNRRFSTLPFPSWRVEQVPSAFSGAVGASRWSNKGTYPSFSHQTPLPSYLFFSSPTLLSTKLTALLTSRPRSHPSWRPEMVRLCPDSLLVLRCLQRRNVGIRRLHSRHWTLLQRLARNSRDGLCHYQCGDKSKRRDGGAVSCPVPRACEGWVGFLGELWYVIIVIVDQEGVEGAEKGAKECASGYNIQSDTGDVLVCDPNGQWR